MSQHPSGTTESSQSQQTDLNEALELAIAAVRDQPGSADLWDRLEKTGGFLNRVEDVAAVYRDILRGDLDKSVADVVGKRAVAYHETWLGDEPNTQVKVLTRVLELLPEARWAFEQLTSILTLGERWDELLALYDRALEAATDEDWREEILDEAANIARDFAGEAKRAISYLQQQLKIRPESAPLAAALERLLEREEEWEALIDLWHQRLDALGEDAPEGLQVRIAACWLDRLERPDQSLAELRRRLADHPDDDDARELLERLLILDPDSITAQVRDGVLSQLRIFYAGRDEPDQIIRVLTVALEFGDRERKIELHREIAEREVKQERTPKAVDSYVALLTLGPDLNKDHLRLRHLTERCGAYGAYVRGLVAAAEACGDATRRIALRLEAAHVYRDVLVDGAAAIDLFASILGEPGLDPALALPVARNLRDLLQQAERQEELLSILERLAGLETDADVRRATRGEAALLAADLGKHDRALAAWRARLGEDPRDRVALDTVVDLLLELERWEPLVAALRDRAGANISSHQRRSDLVDVAEIFADELDRPEEAIDTWRAIQKEFGETVETVEKLAGLLTKVANWSDLAGLLERVAGTETARVADFSCRLGDVFRTRLSQPERAVKCYEASLNADPEHAGARTGLKELLGNPAAGREAVEVLSRLYYGREEFVELAQIAEFRLRVVEDPVRRVRVLRETAGLQEKHVGDKVAALGYLRRAMGLEPQNLNIEDDVVRLATDTGDWETAVNAYREAIASLGAQNPERGVELRLKVAALLEDKLGRLDEALASFRAALGIEPGNLVAARGAVRTGGAEADWQAVVAAFISVTGAHKKLDAEMLETIEQRANETGAYPGLAKVMAPELLNLAGDLPIITAELEARLATWLIEQCEDDDGGRLALRRSLALEPGHVTRLEQLAGLERATPNHDLLETLLALAAQRGDHFDELYEAAGLARQLLGDTPKTREIFDDLLTRSAALWNRGVQPAGARDNAACCGLSIDSLSEMYEQAGEKREAAQLLARGGSLPFDSDVSQDMRVRSAGLYVELQERLLAIDLYQGVIDERPEDIDLIRLLAPLCEAEERFPQVLALRRRELELTPPGSERLVLRLDIARIVGIIEARGGRVEALISNLDEHPGHNPSLEALTEVLTDKGRIPQLTDFLCDHAQRLEGMNKGPQAAKLWSQAADLCEQNLVDIDRALECHRRVVALEPDLDSLDALSRLHFDRQEFGDAVPWLGRRLEHTPSGPERTVIVMQLAKAHVGATQIPEAIRCLERANAEQPSETQIRDRLADLYRESGMWVPLADLLLVASDHIFDPKRAEAALREAATIYREHVEEIERAAGVLRKLAALAPEDFTIRSELADSLLAAGQLTEARQVLEDLVADYGRRRSSERATVHYRLAQLMRDNGEFEPALQELDQAAKMAVGNTAILLSLAEVARDAGQHDRAERAFRALLLAARRNPKQSAVGIARARYELSCLAAARGQDDQAHDLLESAVSVALGNDDEAKRLQRVLAERKDAELLIRILESRIEGTDGLDRARLQAELADAMEMSGRADEALELRLQALRLAGENAEVHDATREHTARIGQSQRYIDVLNELLTGAREQDHLERVVDLTLRMADVYERDLQEFDSAQVLYMQVEGGKHRFVDAWVGLARIAAARGDRQRQVELLEKISALPEEELSAEARAHAAFGLAELHLSDPDSRDAGLTAIRRALEADPRYDIAEPILRRAIGAAGDHEGLNALYEEVVRALGDENLLLEYLEGRAALADVDLERVREAVHLADKLGADDRCERLLHRVIELTTGDSANEETALWGYTELASRSRKAGDIVGAIALVRQAREINGGASMFDLSHQLAMEAIADDTHRATGVELLEEMRLQDPANRVLWEPLMKIYREAEDHDRFSVLVVGTLDTLEDKEERVTLRLELVRLVLADEGREAEAVKLLRDVLTDVPGHRDAQGLLAEVFERTGYDEELVELLQQQLTAVREKGDVEDVIEISLRLGTLLGKTHPEEALKVLRDALDLAPENRGLIEALLSQMGEEHDPRDRAEIMERLLAIETGEEAVALALQLAELWSALEDVEAVTRVLDLGCRAAPQNVEIRNRLEEFYRTHERWGELADLLVFAAKSEETPVRTGALLREAAGLYREHLDKPQRATEVLREAYEALPEDMELLRELTTAMAAVGEHADAISAITAALDNHQMDRDTRVSFLRQRAELRTHVGDQSGAVEDLEAAHAIVGADLTPDLIAGLEQLIEVAGATDDRETERKATLRLVELLDEQGDEARARAALAAWADQDPTDVEVLQRLLDMDTASENWDAVVENCSRLIAAAEGEAQIEAGKQLLAACEKADNSTAARAGLEIVYENNPDNDEIREQLKKIYTEVEAYSDLARILIREAAAVADEEKRFVMFRQAGELLLDEDGEAAAEALKQALELKPGDQRVIVMLVEAYAAAEKFDDAHAILDKAIASMRGRRSPDLSALQYRKACLARSQKDGEGELRWLKEAYHSDRNNGDVAVELADLAEKREDYDLAIRVLRSIALMDAAPISRAMAYLRQGYIADRRGDRQKAVLWGRKALMEDPNCDEATTFLQEIGEL